MVGAAGHAPRLRLYLAGPLSAFHRLRARLREELGVSPSAETEALFTSILRGRIGP